MTAALEGGEWSAARPGRTLPPGKTRYPLYRRLGGPQGRSGRAENLIPTGIRSRTIQPVVSRYTDWATWPTNNWMVVDNNLQSIWKKAAVAWLDVPSWHLPGVGQKQQKTLVGMAGVPSGIRTVQLNWIALRCAASEELLTLCLQQCVSGDGYSSHFKLPSITAPSN